MKNSKEHGINIGIKRVDNNFFIKLEAIGMLTHEDYKIMVPMIENAIKGIQHPELKVLFDGTNFDGWETRAMWDDLKFGLSHIGSFTKIAFVGKNDWEQTAIKIANWFSIVDDIRYFKNLDEAYEWIMLDELDTKDPVKKDLLQREDDIQKELQSLFEKHLSITDIDVPEADDKKAANIILDILSKQLDNLKKEVISGKYDNY
jgi:hypothetical protein